MFPEFYDFTILLLSLVFCISFSYNLNAFTKLLMPFNCADIFLHVYCGICSMDLFWFVTSRLHF